MAFVRHRFLTRAVCACAIAAVPALKGSAQSPDALAVLDQSIVRAEESLRVGERQLAESHYRDALMVGWMIAGGLDVSAGQLEDAGRAYERAAASAVENGDALHSIAVVRLQLGEAAEAAEILTRMASASPRNVQVKLTLARALVAMGKPEEAAQELEEAQATGPKDPELLFALATGFLQLKNADAAERLFARVAAARPQAETYVLIGRTYRDFQRYDRARTALRRALTMNPRVARAHYYLGSSALLEEGMLLLDEAIAEFRLELKNTPGDPLATLRLGVLLVEARRYDEAMPLLESAVRGPAPSFDAWLFLGRCQLALGRSSDAVSSLRRALVAAEKSGLKGRRGLIHYQLATALRQSGASAEAEREFEEAQRLSVQQVESERERLARFLTDTTEASAAGALLPPGMSVFGSLTPEERTSLRGRVDVALSRAYINLGIIHAQASRFSRAAELFEASAAIDPAFPQVQYSLGVAYFNSEQYDKAVPALVKALEQQPQTPEASRMLALASLNAGDYVRAADLLRKDPALPSDPKLQYAFGLALVRSNRADEAEKIFTRVLTQHPDVPELNVVLGQIHAAQGDFDEAVVSLRRAVELKKDVPEANATLGDIYMRQGQFGPAVDALRAELAAHPGNVTARNTLATVLDLDGRSEEALKELAIIVAAKPNYADARYLFGKILLAGGKADEALRQLEIAARLAPEDANIHYQLGQAYQRLGRAEAAARAFETFQRLKDKARGGKS
jgi:tetratricopeptide (TPR) repeat protein